MTTGPITVDQMYLTFSEDDGTTYTAVACQTDGQYNPTIDTIEQDCKDTAGGASYIKGKTRWGMSGSADFAFDSAYGYKQLHDKMVTGDAKVKVRITTGSSETGDFFIEGDALLTGAPLSSAGGSNALVTYSYELLGIGIPALTVI